MARLHLMFSGSWPTLVGVVVWLIILVTLGTNWPTHWYASPRPILMPNPMPWVDFLIFALSAIFLSVKATIMLQRMGTVDRLTLALATANFAFVALYVYAISRPILPELVNVHPKADEWVTVGLRAGLLLTLIWGLWSLTNARPIIIIESNKTIEWTGEQVGGEMTMHATVPTDSNGDPSTLSSDSD